ncbi:hypothetical protein [Polymorphospora sp. NPDC050346]|uniref:hypothetical protein n=1 Tax=Polymorphospora sp. NPDC050346 TaxID=3155780 RepID=UPI0033DF0C6A
MINPGERPVPDATVEESKSTIIEFAEAVARRGGHLAGVPVRDPDDDGGGRYGYRLAGANGQTVRIRIPGIPTARLVGLAAEVPCVYVEGWAWWWRDAVTQAAAATIDRRMVGGGFSPQPEQPSERLPLR